jgi:hypothetical protein
MHANIDQRIFERNALLGARVLWEDSDTYQQRTTKTGLMPAKEGRLWTYLN